MTARHQREHAAAHYRTKRAEREVDAAIAVGDRNYRRLRDRLDECDVRLEAARSMLRHGGYLTH